MEYFVSNSEYRQKVDFIKNLDIHYTQTGTFSVLGFLQFWIFLAYNEWKPQIQLLEKVNIRESKAIAGEAHSSQCAAAEQIHGKSKERIWVRQQGELQPLRFLRPRPLKNMGENYMEGEL